MYYSASLSFQFARYLANYGHKLVECEVPTKGAIIIVSLVTRVRQ
jgi:hypothetical protein